jgi:hypothetical protein
MRRLVSNALRVAMWSGPRNISTAMMRAWESRGDTAVWDEPLYAYYLKRTGLDHPGAGEVIACGESDWRRVVNAVTGPVPEDKPIFFQKHMTHHLLDEVDRSWLANLRNCFLIRDPREVIASYARTRPDLVVSDVGIVQQSEIFDYVARAGGDAPLVVDARDVLENPRGLLAALCTALGVEFSERMLAWSPGPRASDGVWAKYWYDTVLASTGFAPYVPKGHRLAKDLEPFAEECAPHYLKLHERRLRA